MSLEEGNFCYKEGVLYCEDIEISRLEDMLMVENLTPCYVYSRYFSYLTVCVGFHDKRLEKRFTEILTPTNPLSLHPIIELDFP